MEQFAQWLFTMTGASLLIVAAESCMPKGAVRQVGKLSCGLLLLLTLGKPLLSWEFTDVFSFSGGIAEKEEAENYYYQQMKTIIEQQLSTYIVDKAKEEGYTCLAVVSCTWGEEGYFLPMSVELHDVAVAQQDFFRRMIEEDLGVDNIIFHTNSN